jgi:hypothetical protein
MTNRGKYLRVGLASAGVTRKIVCRRKKVYPDAVKNILSLLGPYMVNFSIPFNWVPALSSA